MAELLFYIVFVNLVAFVAFGIDKLKAGRGGERMSENVLMLLALLGGSVGAYLGMKLWHHKTLHKKFRYGIPLIAILQVLVCFYFFSCGF